jgi:hypothetical protein
MPGPLPPVPFVVVPAVAEFEPGKVVVFVVPSPLLGVCASAGTANESANTAAPADIVKPFITILQVVAVTASTGEHRLRFDAQGALFRK